MEYRILVKEDVEEYRRVRLQLLQEHPSFFGSSYEEEVLFPMEQWIHRVVKSTTQVIGAFDNNVLVGITVVVRNPRHKMKHIASLHSMYVIPKYRQLGVGKTLILHAINNAKENQCTRLNLSVVTTNDSAVHLYKSLGFETYGIEPEVIQHNGTYHDLYLMSLNLTN